MTDEETLGARPILTLNRIMHFEAAHQLPYVEDGHKCKNLHGHSFAVEISVKGYLDKDKGWVVDFAVLDKILGKIHENLDHKLLNCIDGLENPTSEMLAIWIWDKVSKGLIEESEKHIKLYYVKIQETCKSSCIYYGPNGP